MTHSEEIFMRLMRVALSGEGDLGCVLSPDEWNEMLDMAIKQSVPGVAFCGVERLPAHQRPEIDQLMDWATALSTIEKENVRLNALCAKVCSIFHSEGINACVMKGQGIGALYDQPLRRSPGDIDVMMEGGEKVVVDYIRRNFPKSEYGGGHHIAVTINGNVSMEVHHTPSMMYSPFKNRVLRKWYAGVEPSLWNNEVKVITSRKQNVPAEEQDMAIVNVPCDEFNQVFILYHLFHHWAFEGCGMKQLVDYFYLLKRTDRVPAAVDTLKKLGMHRFLAAVMYIMQQFGLPEERMLCKPDERKGERLLQDILLVGTVGAEELLSGKYGKEGKLHKFCRRLGRTRRMFSLAPSEIAWVLPKNVLAWCQGKTSGD